jgi:hypothetical protein
MMKKKSSTYWIAVGHQQSLPQTFVATRCALPSAFRSAKFLHPIRILNFPVAFAAHQSAFVAFVLRACLSDSSLTCDAVR